MYCTCSPYLGIFFGFYKGIFKKYEIYQYLYLTFLQIFFLNRPFSYLHPSQWKVLRAFQFSKKRQKNSFNIHLLTKAIFLGHDKKIVDLLKWLKDGGFQSTTRFV